MVVAIPTMIIGLKLSTVAPRMPGNFMQEGQSLLYMALKRITLGPIPSTHDVFLHPTAFAAWAGFFVTSLNLLPFMQLDGGHVAYALFGHKHDAWSRRAWWVPAAMLLYNGWVHAWPVLRASSSGAALNDAAWAPVVSSVSLWGTLLVLLLVFRRISKGVHPPVDDPSLDRTRTLVARGTLILAILLFMPSPLVAY
jgi:membrane-associated protease RseP (regulator of RpoE activity)